MENFTEQQSLSNFDEDEIEIDLREVFYLLLGNWKTIFLAMLIGAVITGSFHVFFMPASYQADAEIYITNKDSLVTLSDLQLSAALTDDYAKIIKSRTVLKRVIQELELDLTYKELQELVEVTNPDSTHIIDIKVTCGDLELSRNIANALLNISVQQIYQIIGSSEPTVIDYSEAEAVENVTPSFTMFLLIGAFAGALIVCAVLIIRMLLNTTIKSEEEMERYLNLPVLSAIPYYREK
ncbi:MAG: Wzz/FepE/Etk N-terminal domain-containing protein [Eubacteriales bacterium]|nr:Wzz/FepE/Etk N-terminal domain-containing protein [Eubacteriales bacterium]